MKNILIIPIFLRWLPAQFVKGNVIFGRLVNRVRQAMHRQSFAAGHAIAIAMRPRRRRIDGLIASMGRRDDVAEHREAVENTVIRGDILRDMTSMIRKLIRSIMKMNLRCYRLLLIVEKMRQSIIQAGILRRENLIAGGHIIGLGDAFQEHLIDFRIMFVKRRVAEIAD